MGEVNLTIGESGAWGGVRCDLTEVVLQQGHDSIRVFLGDLWDQRIIEIARLHFLALPGLWVILNYSNMRIGWS